MVRIDPDKCIQCGMCVRECPHRLLTNTESGISAFGEGCIQCGHCVAVCPQEAVSLTEYDMSEVERVPDETERLDAAGLLRAIKSRRSIRHFKDCPVEEEKLLQIIEAARYSPTGANRQGVKYQLFRASKQELTEKTLTALCKILEERPPQVELELIDRYQKRWPEMLYEYREQRIDRLFYHAPAVLVITGNDRVDAALAASHAELMAYALGLGCVFVGFLEIAARTDEIRNYLALSPEQSVVCCLAIGYPNIQYMRTAPRKKADVVVR